MYTTYSPMKPKYPATAFRLQTTHDLKNATQRLDLAKVAMPPHPTSMTIPWSTCLLHTRSFAAPKDPSEREPLPLYHHFCGTESPYLTGLRDKKRYCDPKGDDFRPISATATLNLFRNEVGGRFDKPYFK